MTTQTIFITQGTDYTSQLQILNANGIGINVSSFHYTGLARQNPYAYANTPLTVTITDGPNGNIAVSLSAANSANMAPGTYLYAVTQIDTSNVTTQVLNGNMIINVNPLVTQPLPNVGIQLLDDQFFALANQNSFYLSFAPANANAVTVSHNYVPLAANAYTLTGKVLILANLCSQGDIVEAQETTD